MRQLLGLRTRIVLALAAILLLLPFPTYPTKAALAVPTINGCFPNVGKKIPVLYVQGFWGYGGEWLVGSPSLQQVISGISGVYADGTLDAFDYKRVNTHWVSDDNIGKALAMKIECMAKSSPNHKIIVVAYSMGGLATRYAAHIVLDGHYVSDDLGLVITIATPNTGAKLADWASSMLRPLCTFGVISFAGQQYQANPTSCDQILPAMWAMETNLLSNVNSLSKFPKSVPVMAIAGNVSWTIPLYFTKLSLGPVGSDLVVGIDSALADANSLPQGGGKYITPQCIAQVPIVSISGANCDHTHLLTNKYVRMTVVQSIQHYLDYLHPPCPIIAGICAGIQSGDMDADGIADRVGVTWLPNACANGAPSSCRIGVRIILDNGDVIDSTIPWSNAYGYNVTSLQFMGLSDVNGDRRDEVFLKMDGDCGACSAVLVYELGQDTLQQLVFPSSDSSIGVGLSLGIAGFGGGFTCRMINGHNQVLAATWDINSNQATEWLYQANADGTMSLIKQDTTTYTLQQEIAEEGAHCPGLGVS